MTRHYPMRCCWSGQSFVPDGRTLAYCREQFGAGEVVTLERCEEISAASYGHYYASLSEAWNQLPESLMAEYPTVRHLRAKALIRTGQCDESSIVCKSAQDAATCAAFIQTFDEYSIIDVSDNVIRRYTAKSQSRKAMNKKTFNESKDKVLQFVSDLIGVTPQKLKQNI